MFYFTHYGRFINILVLHPHEESMVTSRTYYFRKHLEEGEMGLTSDLPLDLFMCLS